MTDFDVVLDMTRATMIDDKIESLLRGVAPDAADPVARELASIRQGLSEAFPLPVISEHVEDSHLARMMAAVVPLASFNNSEVAADRTSPLTALKASFARRVAAVTLALSTAFGGAAYAGVLPDPIQRAAAKAAAVVGWSLPGLEDDTLADDDSGTEDDLLETEGGNGPNEVDPFGGDSDAGETERSDVPAAEKAEDGNDDTDQREDDSDDSDDGDSDDGDSDDGDSDDSDSDDGDSDDGDSDGGDSDDSDSDDSEDDVDDPDGSSEEAEDDEEDFGDADDDSEGETRETLEEIDDGSRSDLDSDHATDSGSDDENDSDS